MVSKNHFNHYTLYDFELNILYVIYILSHNFCSQLQLNLV